MKCENCENKRLTEVDDELICNDCGSAFGLEYLGMYEQVGSERIDEGFESKEFKDKIAKFRKQNKR